MSRSCSICTRSDAGAIAELLHSGRSARSVALELGVGEDALGRHAKHHVGRVQVPKALLASKASTDPLDELVVALRERALAGSDAASREYRLALEAQSRARHAAAPTRDLATEPEWIALRGVMLAALEDEPAARMKVADALAAAGVD